MRSTNKCYCCIIAGSELKINIQYIKKIQNKKKKKIYFYMNNKNTPM
jgi:hypothetical protein